MHKCSGQVAREIMMHDEPMSGNWRPLLGSLDIATNGTGTNASALASGLGMVFGSPKAVHPLTYTVM